MFDIPLGNLIVLTALRSKKALPSIVVSEVADLKSIDVIVD